MVMIFLPCYYIKANSDVPKTSSIFLFVVGGRCNYAQRAEFLDNERATRQALYLRYTTNRRKSYAFFILRYIGKFRDISTSSENRDTWARTMHLRRVRENLKFYTTNIPFYTEIIIVVTEAP